MPKIIGLTGNAFAGKDTAAKIIKKYINERDEYYSFDNIASSSLIKEAYKILFNLAKTIKKYFNEREEDKIVETFAFASPIKEACKILFNLTESQLHNHDFKEKIDERWGISPRQMFQLVGETMRNKVSKDFFLMSMKQRIENSKADYIIITDVRFNNEAELVRSLGGIIIKIVRDNKTTQHSNHESEQGIDSSLVSSFISNNSTIEEFENNVEIVFSSLIDK